MTKRAFLCLSPPGYRPHAKGTPVSPLLIALIGAVLVVSSFQPVMADTTSWAGKSTDLNNSSNWTNGLPSGKDVYFYDSTATVLTNLSGALGTTSSPMNSLTMGGTGNVTNTGGSVYIGAGGVTTNAGSGSLSLWQTYLKASQTWTINSSNDTTLYLLGQVSGEPSRDFTKEGTGTLAISYGWSSTASILKGNWYINNGTVRFKFSPTYTYGAINDSSTLTLGSGTNSGKLILGATSSTRVTEKMAGLYTSGTGTDNAVVGDVRWGNWGVLALEIPDGVNDVYSGRLGGTSGNEMKLALTKSGPGTLTLTGMANNYVGATTVNAGSLFVNGVITGTGGDSSENVVTVNAGTLGGSGSIRNKDISILGGALAPGASAGSLEIGGNLSLAAAAALNIEVTGSSFTLNGLEQYDRLVVGGNVDLGGSTLNVSLAGYTPANGDLLGIVDVGGNLTGKFGNYAEGDVVYENGLSKLLITYAGNISGDVVSLTGGNDVVLYAQVIPEPSTVMLLLTGCLGLALFARKRQ